MFNSAASKGKHRESICRLLFLASVASALLAGCATTNAEVTSEKDATYTERLGRVLLVTQFDSDQEKAFGEQFRQHFSRAVTERGVEVAARALGTLDLNTKPLHELADEYRTDLVMVVGQTRGETKTSAIAVPVGEHVAVPLESTTEHADFEANLFLVSQKQRIWRAQIVTDYEEVEDVIPKMVKGVVARLERDGLVASAIDTNR